MTKNEPDYRLFLVHILENLQRLDDRPVRDAERSTASIHFAQNKKWTRFQKAERAEQTVEKETAPVKYTNERVDYIKNVRKFPGWFLTRNCRTLRSTALTMTLKMFEWCWTDWTMFCLRILEPTQARTAVWINSVADPVPCQTGVSQHRTYPLLGLHRSGEAWARPK